MRASTELLLWEIYTIAGTIFCPTPPYLPESFDDWARKRGLLPNIRRLEENAYLERLPGGRGDRVYRLTESGRLAAFGGKDPQRLWGRSWDGLWRILAFDLPAYPKKPRRQMVKTLRDFGFGCLQGSVWISPDPFSKLRSHLWGDCHPSSLTLLEGRLAGGESAREVVRESWDFCEIEAAWSYFKGKLIHGMYLYEQTFIDPQLFHNWATEEHLAWKGVVAIDPFLPECLLPSSYPGRRIWGNRLELWQKLGQRLRKGRRALI